LRPTTPQQADGIRIDPVASPPDAAGTTPVDTATAEPPLDPPGERSAFHGLTARPRSSDSVAQ
jgi:hypothetical protein